jgi:hypothetical protein
MAHLRVLKKAWSSGHGPVLFDSTSAGTGGFSPVDAETKSISFRESAVDSGLFVPQGKPDVVQVRISEIGAIYVAGSPQYDVVQCGPAPPWRGIVSLF